MIRRRLFLALVCLWLAVPSAVLGSEVKQIAMMVRYPFTSGWNCASDDDALILSSGVILREALQESEGLHLVSWGYTAGIQKAMAQGLYFPTGKTAFERWSALLAADIYVEFELSKKQATWSAHSATGTVTETVEQPFFNPKAVAAALVNATHRAADLPIEAALQAELEDPEAQNPALFMEWAKWIGYRPHWCHHAPWQGPRKSASRILENGAEFARGLAWAIHMMRKQTKRMNTKPTGEEFLEHALTVLGSPHYDSVVPLIREWADKRAILNKCLRAFGSDALALEVDMGTAQASATAGVLSEANQAAEEDKAPASPRLRRNLITALGTLEDEKVKEVLAAVAKEDPDESVRTAARDALAPPGPATTAVAKADAEDPFLAERRALAALLETEADLHKALAARIRGLPDSARSRLCRTAYEAAGSDRRRLARIMYFDPGLEVNLAGIRLLLRLGDKDLTEELLARYAREHPNEYVRARALRELEKTASPALGAICRAGLASPFWVLRLEAADILTRHGTPNDEAALEQALAEARDEWLKLALTDALCKARGNPLPEHHRLGLAEPPHTPGGDAPIGFQTWLGRMPKNVQARQHRIAQGFRFGSKTKEPDFPGSMVVRTYNASKGVRNAYLLEGILEPLAKRRDDLPYHYYIALFDEPGSWGRASSPDRVRAFLLEAGRPDLLRGAERDIREKGDKALPKELRPALEYHNAMACADASNWVVHLFRVTAGRKYRDLHIFPQSMTYMRAHSADAFHLLDGDGDYSWLYHRGNFFRDGSIGAINRVLHPGKPACVITWMGWHRPNILNGNRLDIDSDWWLRPWRIRHYFGLRSALALWATGTEAGFFDSIGLGKTTDKDAQAKLSTALSLKPWSPAAEEAVAALMADPLYWKQVEGKLEYKKLKQQGGAAAPDMGTEDVGDDDDLGMDLVLEDQPDPVQEALKEEKKKLYSKLMAGISYMNIYGTDTCRALSNLPRPDTRPRSSLIIMGRGTAFYGDGSHFPIPATALLDGYDMCPTYDCVPRADLMQYDTILLDASGYGVTTALVTRINQWLREKDGGLLILSGAVTSRKRLFPMLTLDDSTEPFLWEEAVTPTVLKRTDSVEVGRRRSKRTVMYPPRMQSLAVAPSGETLKDGMTRVGCTYAGAVEPLVTAAEERVALARWRAPAAVKCVVLFDGAFMAGPVYTGALESIIKALDKERGSSVRRNPYWGHTIYETEAFVVDVATTQLQSLLAARPRQHRGVDVVTGVINPTVTRGECALILKDYIGPYAGGKGDWAVLARKELKAMEVKGPMELAVHAVGVTRVTHIGPQAIRLSATEGFAEVEDQIQVWKAFREGKPAYSLNDVKGGKELHFVSPEPVVVLAE